MRNTDTASPLSDGRNTLEMKLSAPEERGTGAWQVASMGHVSAFVHRGAVVLPSPTYIQYLLLTSHNNYILPFE